VKKKSGSSVVTFKVDLQRGDPRKINGFKGDSLKFTTVINLPFPLEKLLLSPVPLQSPHR
jgi:hypothetical protein